MSELQHNEIQPASDSPNEDGPLRELLSRVHARTAMTPPSTSGGSASASDGQANSNGTGQGVPDSPLGSPLPTPPATSASAEGHNRQRSRSVFEGDNIGADSDITAVTRAGTMFIGQTLKRARKLGPQSEVDLDIFLAAGPIVREAQQYAMSLECRDLLKTISSNQEYKIPESLKRTAQDYGWAYMLSPALMSYRAADAPEKVLRVMRQLAVANIPPVHETARCEAIVSVIGKALTDCRHHIKNKVNETLKSGYKGPKDIGSLTAVITSRTRVKPTAALYLRIAAVRYNAKKYPMSAEDAFWLAFDEKLATYRKNFQTPVNIQVAYQEIYEDDVNLFGAPDVLTHPTLNPNHQADWIVALSTAASLPIAVTTIVGRRSKRS